MEITIDDKDEIEHKRWSTDQRMKHWALKM